MIEPGPRPWRSALIPVLVAWAALAVVSGIWDLHISRAVVNRDSGWGNFGADYGEVPGFVVCGLSLALLIGWNLRRRASRVLGMVLVAVVLPLLSIFAWQRAFDLSLSGSAAETSDLALLVGAVVATLALGLVAWRLPDRLLQALWRPAAVIVVLALLNPLLFVQVAKALWGRVRFRDLGPEFGDFTPWFLPRGVTGHRSFPSGHAAMGWMFLPIAFTLCARGTTRRPAAAVAVVTVFAWGIFVAASRVVVGAHYLSDVTFSTGVAFLLTILFSRAFRVWRRGADNGAVEPPSLADGGQGAG